MGNPEELVSRADSGRSICLADDESGEDHDGFVKAKNNDENFDPNLLSSCAEPPVGMMTKLKDRRSLMKKQTSSRRRRRSSARFLMITPDDDDGRGDGEGGHYDGTSSTCLGEVYRNAIRMNAENRINASNSWNLNLIDHLDRFIAPELRSGIGGGSGGRHLQTMNGGSADNTASAINNTMESTMDSTMISGVNFTKASCTLDASVKIYSYRVDDVHLTSYKVLANLNRTDASAICHGKKKNSANVSGGSNDEGTDDDGDEPSTRSTKSRGNTNVADTLEHNVANINIHKLDAAFDIDPLFHKMSKTFDEGGAKGLLLANLGVGSSGCNIVFDSTLDTEDIAAAPVRIDGKNNPEIIQNGEKKMPPKATVDVTSLVGKLDNLLSSAPGNYNMIENMPLVPQLAYLRNQYAELGECGFVEEVGISSDRYTSSLEEEAEADKSIHLEAIERSRASQADLGRSMNSRGSLGTYGSIGDDEYGGGSFVYGDDDDDVFGDLHNGDHRFSSSSFERARASISSFGNSNGTDNEGAITTEPSKFSPPTFSKVSVLLDAIASGDISTVQAGNHYEYFNSQALESLSAGNLWAGAEHWKKMPSNRRRKTRTGIIGDDSSRNCDTIKSNVKANFKKKKKGKSKLGLSSNSNLLVSISKPIENLDALLEIPKRKHGKKAADPVQLTKAMYTRYGKINNLLPIDAGLGIKELVTLFLRPKVNLADMAKSKQQAEHTIGMGKSTKAVGFGGVETWGEDDDNSYGVDGDGIGFDFADNGGGYYDANNQNKFVVPDLEDVRKVDKIKIGYATVARKVDVKRLKRDLWTELEQTFASGDQNVEMEGILKHEDSDDLSTASTVSDPDFGRFLSNDDVQITQQTETTSTATSLSFQDTVRDMQATQSQSDVTLPFYFICILHLCNEKGLALESSGLEDFVIHSS